jgi:hypothetical protein
MQKQGATASKENGLDKPILQRTATPGNGCRRIVAPKVAGSSPVGHPPEFRIGKANQQNRGCDLVFMPGVSDTTAVGEMLLKGT